jgi:hypothetical protein
VLLPGRYLVVGLEVLVGAMLGGKAFQNFRVIMVKVKHILT